MHLHHLLDSHLLGRADAPALDLVEHPERGTITFGQIEADAQHLAAVLRQRGLTRGDRLALYLPNRYEYLTLFLACTRLGVILVPVNILYKEREIAHIVADSRPAALVFSGDVPAGTGDVPRWDVTTLTTDTRYEGREALDGDTPAALVYTSGTTGRSKGAVLTHNNFLANATSLLAAWRITEHDRYLATLPLFHVHGLANGVVSWLASGCRMWLAERFVADRVATWFATYRPTLFFGVPTMYHRLLQLPDATARAIGEGMRLFVCGSAPLPAPVMDAFRARFGHVILERYGMSETLMNIGNPYTGERRPGSVGVPFPGVSVRIVDEQGTDRADGEIGEVWVRGPNVCKGYWDNADATARAFTGGWFRTGDLGERSADGYYTLRGRMSDLIISGGFNIYPREIEELLLDQPGVTEAAVVGVADAARGELPVAYVVGTANADDLLATCRAQLATFKVPRAVVTVEALPRTALGKVQKHLLPSPA